MRPILAIAGLVTVLLSACVSESRPPTCNEPDVTLELTLTADSLTPTDPAVCRGQEVTLLVDSQVDGTLHIHGYDEQVPASTVTAGEELRLEFTASRPGQFSIEMHTDARPQGASVGVFTVHEP